MQVVQTLVGVFADGMLDNIGNKLNAGDVARQFVYHSDAATYPAGVSAAN